MANLSTETHPEWGIIINQHPRIYCHEAPTTEHGALIDKTRQAMWSFTALDTIEQICILADPKPKNYEYTDYNARIPLAKLKTVLNPTCFLFELEIFASPKLIAGCISLMSSIKPSSMNMDTYAFDS
ncbi:hypothetical protein RSOLAG22IIIB_12678 [Rhizoctonia solani]|uniref:Uncharacterized protein n=1 Tax=Rhizoctonia solani TaxID=456999 RepID=A0A0K6GFR4_9AGAM|nr:hypothetical protein RSOLAG22IIIB_12678 [Rhizoctonia solani]